MRKFLLAGASSALLPIVSGFFVTVAHAAPVANLPLTCSSASAIGQPQNNCSGDWAYQTPTAELIVLKGPSSTATWIRASNLTSSDTVNVCTLPVEPGTYSNCRDAAGVRRYAFVPKSQVFPGSSPPPSSGTAGNSPGSIAVVAATGGRYADPLAAAANAEQGDAWCRREGDDPARYPCVISIAPGIYELASTLIVPAHVSVIGYGPNMTVLRARPGVAVTVQLGFAGLDQTLDVALRDLAVENRLGAGATAVALDIIDNSNVEVHNVRATASGASENVGMRYAGRTVGSLSTPLRLLEAAATGGSTSIGFQVVNRGGPQIEECSISASEASTRNVGVESNGGATLARCDVTATGGVTAIAMSIVGNVGIGAGGASSEVSDSKLVAGGASTENTGYFSRGTFGAIWKRVEVDVRGQGSATGISLSQSQPFHEGSFDDVNVLVFGGATNVGMYLEGGHHDGFSMVVSDSGFSATIGGASYGIRLGGGAPEARRLSVVRSSISGFSAALFSDAPFIEWGTSGVGPPLTVSLVDTSLGGAVNVNGHYLDCVAIIHGRNFYPDTCPPGDWTPSPR